MEANRDRPDTQSRSASRTGTCAVKLLTEEDVAPLWDAQSPPIELRFIVSSRGDWRGTIVKFANAVMEKFGPHPGPEGARYAVWKHGWDSFNLLLNRRFGSHPAKDWGKLWPSHEEMEIECARASAWTLKPSDPVDGFVRETEARERERKAWDFGFACCGAYPNDATFAMKRRDQSYPSLCGKPRTVRLSDGRTYKYDTRDIDGSRLWLYVSAPATKARGEGWSPCDGSPTCYTSEDFRKCAELLEQEEGK
jgi:hypothetical protein